MAQQIKPAGKEMPWSFWAFLSGLCVVVAILVLVGVLDFADKPGTKKGLLVIFTGLHEIFGPSGPAGLAGLLALFFGRTAYKKKKSGLIK